MIRLSRPIGLDLDKQSSPASETAVTAIIPIHGEKDELVARLEIAKGFGLGLTAFKVIKAMQHCFFPEKNPCTSTGDVFLSGAGRGNEDVTCRS
jgi:hypothetical protein